MAAIPRLDPGFSIEGYLTRLGRIETAPVMGQVVRVVGLDPHEGGRIGRSCTRRRLDIQQRAEPRIVAGFVLAFVFGGFGQVPEFDVARHQQGAGRR